jgi:hypothetical protein
MLRIKNALAMAVSLAILALPSFANANEWDGVTP